MSTLTDTINPTSNNDDRPEPYASVLDLISEHGTYAILEAISDNVQFDSEDDDEDTCNDCRARAARLPLELEQLLDRMADFDDAICSPVEAEPSNEEVAQ